MTLTDADVEKAEKRMQARLHAEPRAVAAQYDRQGARIVVSLSNGLDLGVPVALAQGLAGAKASDLAVIEITPTGLGLHWPKLDADLYLPSLLQGLFGTRRWMASLLGKAGGSATSAAKRAASRSNGKRGGRPRKKHTDRHSLPPALG
jgi:hypothetical protein